MLYYLMKHESCQWLSDTLIDSLADAGITLTENDIAAFKGFYTHLYITSCQKTNQQHCHFK